MFSRFHPVRTIELVLMRVWRYPENFQIVIFVRWNGVSLENAAFKAIVPSAIQNEKFLFLGEQDNVGK